MGYSITVRCRSLAARDEMLAFLHRHYQAWSVIQPEYPDKDFDWTKWIQVNGKEGWGGLSYDDHKLALGYNYSTQGEIGHYGYTVLRWIALQVGQKRTFKEGRVPCVTYDGGEHWPILIGSDQCDEFGFKPCWEKKSFTQRHPLMALNPHTQMGLKFERLVNEASAAEVRRLDGLWKKEKKDGQVAGSGPAQRTRKSPNVERSGSGQPS